MAIRGVLIDLSGTLHVEDQVIPRAVSALLKLRESGRHIKFLTNTTKESANVLYNRLTKCGFTIEKSEIFTSLLAARRLVESKNLRPLLILEDVALEDFEGINTNDPNAVVVGLAPTKFEYEIMNDAFRLLLSGAELIAVHKGKYYRSSDGLSLGPGPFVSALEYASQAESIVVGKPSRTFFELGLNALDSDLSPSEVVMIGDDVRDDILGAIEAGMKAILVKTGKYRLGDEEHIPETVRNCVPSFAEAVDLIESGNVI